MNVLVAGGTGFIGSRVVDELLRGGKHELAVMTRDPSRAKPREGVRYVAGDVSKPETLAEATCDVDVVVHAVQFPNHPVENPRRGWTYEKVDGEGTERMVAAAKANGVRRFVYLSGAGARPGRTEPWFQAKERAELAVTSSGIEWVILRPSWIYGPDDRSMNKFVTFVRMLPVVPVIGSGREQVQPVSVFDVAKVVAAAVDSPAATGQVFDLGSRDPVTMDEIMRTVMRVLGKRRRLVHQPAWLVKIPASLIQYLPNAPLSPGAVDFITMDERVDPTKAEEVFGVRFTPLEDGLRAYLAGDGQQKAASRA
jgi:nucleoside-diphosphate-sugar epimerase